MTGHIFSSAQLDHCGPDHPSEWFAQRPTTSSYPDTGTFKAVVLGLAIAVGLFNLSPNSSPDGHSATNVKTPNTLDGLHQNL